jgi:hypothetical protein
MPDDQALPKPVVRINGRPITFDELRIESIGDGRFQVDLAHAGTFRSVIMTEKAKSDD